MGNCQGKQQENKETVNATLVNQAASVEIQIIRMQIGTLTQALKELSKAERLNLITPDEHNMARTQLIQSFANNGN